MATEDQAPHGAKLTDEDIKKATGKFPEYGKKLWAGDELREAVDAATEKAWRVFLEGIPVENLTSDAQYAAAWGKHSRDAEVAELKDEKAEMQREWHDSMTEVAELQEKLEEAKAKLIDVAGGDGLRWLEERDAALKQVRTMVEALEYLRIASAGPDDLAWLDADRAAEVAIAAAKEISQLTGDTDQSTSPGTGE